MLGGIGERCGRLMGWLTLSRSGLNKATQKGEGFSLPGAEH